MEGTPAPPFTEFSPEICLQKGLKIVFFAQKQLILVQKKVMDLGGTPLPPFTDFLFFGEKGVTDLGGIPPPYTNKIRKVVFDNFSYIFTKMIKKNCVQNLNNLHHDPLAVGLMACLISLAQIEAHPLRVLLRNLLHNVQGPLAQGLPRKKGKMNLYQ